MTKSTSAGRNRGECAARSRRRAGRRAARRRRSRARRGGGAGRPDPSERLVLSAPGRRPGRGLRTESVIRPRWIASRISTWVRTPTAERATSSGRTNGSATSCSATATAAASMIVTSGSSTARQVAAAAASGVATPTTSVLRRCRPTTRQSLFPATRQSTGTFSQGNRWPWPIMNRRPRYSSWAWERGRPRSHCAAEVRVLDAIQQTAAVHKPESRQPGTWPCDESTACTRQLAEP